MNIHTKRGNRNDQSFQVSFSLVLLPDDLTIKALAREGFYDTVTDG